MKKILICLGWLLFSVLPFYVEYNSSWIMSAGWRIFLSISATAAFLTLFGLWQGAGRLIVWTIITFFQYIGWSGTLFLASILLFVGGMIWWDVQIPAYLSFLGGVYNLYWCIVAGLGFTGLFMVGRRVYRRWG